MIDRKLAIVTIHDVNPLHSEEILKTSSELKYNLSIVPYYRKKYNLKDYAAFCDEISSLLQSGNVELCMVYITKQTESLKILIQNQNKKKRKKFKRPRYFNGCQATKAFDVYTTSMAFEPSMYRSIKGIEL